MNRRQFLASLMAVPLVAKAIVAVGGLPAVVEGGLPQEVFTTPFEGWTIHFPDGQIYQFQGMITSLKRMASVDALITDTFDVLPTGPMVVATGPKQMATTISRDGREIGEVTEILPPSMSRETFEVFSDQDNYPTVIPGLKRIGPMSFTVQLEAEHG